MADPTRPDPRVLSSDRSGEEVDFALNGLSTHVTQRQRLGALGAGAVAAQKRHVPRVLQAD